MVIISGVPIFRIFTVGACSSHYFGQKCQSFNIQYLGKFNVLLTNDVVSFVQLSPADLGRHSLQRILLEYL